MPHLTTRDVERTCAEWARQSGIVKHVQYVDVPAMLCAIDCGHPDLAARYATRALRNLRPSLWAKAHDWQHD